MRKRSLGLILLGLAGIILLIPILCSFMSPTYYDVHGDTRLLGVISLISYISCFVLVCAGVIILWLNYEKVVIIDV
ncbi:MAG: hypothetical protein ACFFAK_05510 [Promethearchaeota archaeon]